MAGRAGAACGDYEAVSVEPFLQRANILTGVSNGLILSERYTSVRYR